MRPECCWRWSLRGLLWTFSDQRSVPERDHCVRHHLCELDPQIITERCSDHSKRHTYVSVDTTRSIIVSTSTAHQTRDPYEKADATQGQNDQKRQDELTCQSDFLSLLRKCQRKSDCEIVRQKKWKKMEDLPKWWGSFWLWLWHWKRSLTSATTALIPCPSLAFWSCSASPYLQRRHTLYKTAT